MAITTMDSQLSILQPSGHINASNADEFQRQLTAAVASQQHSVLVDMHRVESLDSAGLMALVAALSLAQNMKRRFSICCVAPSIRIIFELTQLDGPFEIFESREAFLATHEQSENDLRLIA
ncbi:MAG TPA: STAS domain-containing protein [Candidatus Sericytochromatia bacterium]|jgi:anti-sigma B factor antagonist